MTTATPPRWLDRLALAFAFALLAIVLSPLFTYVDRFGAHDWDQMQAHRYLSQKTLEAFHQFPFWDPYTCGGHTWWGAPESGTNVVPWLPLYLVFPLPLAIRLEITFAAALGVVGTWLVAGRFTRSPGLRLLVVAVFAISARWSQQIAVGHTWHLGYAGMPWALFFLDRAGHKRSLRDVVGLGVTLALMLYVGAIYPLPEAVLLLFMYAAFRAQTLRSWRPLASYAAGGLFAVCLAAPRLLPLAVTMRRFPHPAPSEEFDVVHFFAFYTQKSNDLHPPVGPWYWFEFGIYTGWIPLLAMLAAIVMFRRPRERALVYTGVLAWIIGFGRFASWAPWALLHDHLPVFRSQHVPSRWMYPATLFMMLATVAIVSRRVSAWAERKGRHWAWRAELGCLVACLLVALDVDIEARRGLVSALDRPRPKVIETTQPFHQETKVPPELRYADEDWIVPAMPAMMANVGVLECGTFPGLSVIYRDEPNHVPIAARGRTDPAYRGEAYFARGAGSASITSWTPNAVMVRWSDAAPGDVLVLNQNWDPGWRAGRNTAREEAGLVGAQVTASAGEIVFRYRPPYLWLGIVLCVGAVGAAGALGIKSLRRSRRRGPSLPSSSSDARANA